MARYPVLVIQNDAREGLGLIERALARRDVKARVVEAWSGDRVPSTVAGHSALVVLGGPQSAYHAPHVAYLADEVRALREAVATRTPVLGVCLGAQLLAAALGAEVRRGGAGPEVGWAPVARTENGRHDRLLRHLPDDLPVAHWHSDTFDVPPSATLLASSAAYPQAFVAPHDAYGLQFHLEWSPDLARTVGEGDALGGALAAGAPDPERLADVADRVFGAFLDECGCND